MERFREQPYGLEFAVGIEDTFIPQTSSWRRAEPDVLGVNYYPRPKTTEFLPRGKRRTIFWMEMSAAGTIGDYLVHMGMYDLAPGGRGGLRREEPPVVEEFRAVGEEKVASRKDRL